MSPVRVACLWVSTLTAVFAVGCGGLGGERFRVASESMLPTYTPGEEVDVDTDASKLGRGEVVVFHPPTGAEENVCGEVVLQVRRARGRPPPRARTSSSSASLPSGVTA